MTEQKKSIADGLAVNPYDEGVLANLDRAAEKTPVLGTVHKTYKSITEHAKEVANADDLGMDDLASASKNLVADGAKFVGSAAGEAVFYAMDPVGWLVSHGLNMLLELVQPFQDALHSVSGDGPAIGHASENFTTLANGFVQLAADFEKTGDTALKDWIDKGGEAARLALGDFSAGMRGVGSAAGSVADVLKMWSMVMVVIEEVIKAIISELVSFLITIWIPALAASVISFGSTVAAAMTASIGKAVALFKKITKHLGAFGKLLDEFIAFMAKQADKVVAQANRFRLGVKKGERLIPLISKPAKNFVPSRRVMSTAFGTDAGVVGPLAAGAGIKAGIGAAKGLAGEATEEYKSDGPMFDKEGIGGDKSADETRKNLEM
nr:hypothetical protein [Kibdelosporangium sp. MJ126-NF4]CEL21601.1 hypothetical protein [Kibdelosporangium sp. MJ126-NF4]CTQ92382.1 hypothetical protein [Kibdelosporangium sp. MJ126-NF4]